VRTIYSFILFVSILGDVSLYAEEATAEKTAKFPYTFSIGSSMGVLYGQGEEIVFKNNNDQFASQLLWDIKPLVYTGLSLDFSRRDPLEKTGFFGVLDLKFGIPGKTGIMEDRDWIYPDSDQLTHFSSHDNYVKKGTLLLDLFAGVSIPLRNAVYITVYGAFSYMNFNWASRDGYTQYIYDRDEDIQYPSVEEAPKKPNIGPTIDYSQYWFEPALGISVHYPFLKFFTASLSTRISPFSVSARGRDDHLKTGDQYDDYMSGGIGFKPRGEISFSPTPWLSVSFFMGGILMFEISGETYINKAENPEPGVGASFKALDMGLHVKIAL
jgi:outer membrane protease